MKNKARLLYFSMLFILIYLFFNALWILNAKNKLVSEDIIFLGEVKSNINNINNYVVSDSLLLERYSPIPKLIVLPFFFITLPIDELFILNMILFCLSFFLILKIVSYLHGRNSAFWFVLIFLSFPATTQFLRSLYDQMYLMFFYSLSFYLLIRSENFSDKTSSFFYGVSLGLFLLTRQTAVPYVLSQIIFIIVRNKEDINMDFFKKNKIKLLVLLPFYFLIQYFVLKANLFSDYTGLGLITIAVFFFFLNIRVLRPKNRSSTDNIVDSIIYALIIAFPWYLNNSLNLVKSYFNYGLNSNYLISIDFIYYPLTFLTSHSNLILGIIVLILLNKAFTRDKLFFILSIIIPLLIFSVVPAKNYTATFLLIIPVSILAAAGIQKINRTFAVSLGIIFVLAIIYFSYPYRLELELKVSRPFIHVDSGVKDLYHIVYELPLLTRENMIVKSLDVSKIEIQKIDYQNLILDEIKENSTVYVFSGSGSVSAEALSYLNDRGIDFFNQHFLPVNEKVRLNEYDYVIVVLEKQYNQKGFDIASVQENFNLIKVISYQNESRNILIYKKN